MDEINLSPVAVLITGIILLVVSGCTVEGKGIPGDAANFEPTIHLQEVMEYAGDGQEIELVKISGIFVRPDGTINIMDKPEKYAAYVIWPVVWYEFQAFDPVDKNYTHISVMVAKPSNRKVTTTTTYTGTATQTQHIKHRGMEKFISSPKETTDEEPIPLPKFTFADIWEKALKNGASSEKLARIIYDSDGYLLHTGEEGSFYDKDGTYFIFDFDGNLTGKEPH